MGKSYKKGIIKDRIRNGNPASAYHKPIRRVQKQYIKQLKYNDEIEIPDARIIVNDYDKCDWIWDYENIIKGDEFGEELIKNRRK